MTEKCKSEYAIQKTTLSVPGIEQSLGASASREGNHRRQARRTTTHLPYITTTIPITKLQTTYFT